MICPKCQAQNNDDAIFCSQCGASFKNSVINILELKSKRKRFIKSLILSILVLVFISGSAFAFINWHGMIEKPESVLKRMEKKMKKLKTLTIDNNFKMEINLPNDISLLGDTKIKLNFDLLNKIDQKNKKSQNNIELSSAMMGFDIKILAETRFFNDKTYINLKSMPFLALLSGDIENKWIKIDEQGINKINEINKNISEEDRLYDIESWKKTLDYTNDNELFYKANFYEVLKKEKDEKVGGKIAHHYKVKINKKELADFIITDTQEEEKKYVQNFFDNIGEIELDIWVGRLDDLLYKISLKNDFNLQDLKGILSSDEKLQENYDLITSDISDALPQVTGSYDAEIIFSDFNKPIEIEEPAESITIEGFYENLFKELETEKEETKSVKKLSNIKQFQTALEMYYSDNNKYPVSEPNTILGEGSYTCLNSHGFSSAERCSEATIYMAKINQDENGSLCIYNSISFDSYIINFELKEDTSNFKAGKVLALSSGFYSIGDYTDSETDNDGLSSVEEEYYKTDVNNPDTDDDGFLDGDEVRNGFCPIKAKIKIQDKDCYAN